MKIEQINGIYIITDDDFENFWQSRVIKTKDIMGRRPQLKDSLAKWWDQTAPGEWTTAYLSDPPRRCIVIREPRLFMLFKLAFSDSEDIISKIQVLDSACFYAPYIPLTALQNPQPVFKTFYDSEDSEPGEDNGS